MILLSRNSRIWTNDSNNSRWEVKWLAQEHLDSGYWETEGGELLIHTTYSCKTSVMFCHCSRNWPPISSQHSALYSWTTWWKSHYNIKNILPFLIYISIWTVCFIFKTKTSVIVIVFSYTCTTEFCKSVKMCLYDTDTISLWVYNW